jgi:NADPH-dependent curcumin reductase CurA
MTMNLQVRLRSLPQGAVEEGHFELHKCVVPELATDEVLVRNHFLSLDPYMRKRLADAVAGRVALRPGDLMMGRTAGEVIESRDAAFRPGDHVLGWGGWQQYSAEPAAKLEKIVEADGMPLSVYLGVLGRPGITAWLGVVHVADLRRGECFVVSSAAGAVGSLAGQMARHLGARVVGIAGGRAKCEAVTRELGFHDCVDYRSTTFDLALRDATPQGVDACFENVGASVLDATLGRMNENGRIAVCGLLGHYHSGASHAFRNFPRILDRALRMTGFRIDDNSELHERARAELRAWVERGAFRTWETVSQGLESAPAAFVSMLEGRGRGKTLVRIA